MKKKILFQPSEIEFSPHEFKIVMILFRTGLHEILKNAKKSYRYCLVFKAFKIDRKKEKK